MKYNLFALTTLAVLMSGCAHKGTITLYAPEEKVKDSLEMVLTLDDRIKECKDGKSIVAKQGLYDTRFDVPISFTEKTNLETNETDRTVEYGKLYKGVETWMEACFIDNTKQQIKIHFIEKVIDVKPLGSFENENISCSDEITIENGNFAKTKNIKFITCKSK